MIALWAAALLVPLVSAAAFAVAGFAPAETAARRRHRLALLAPVSVVPAGVLALVAPDGAGIEVGWLLLGTSLTLDAIARPLVLLAVVLYGVALAFVPRSVPERAPGLSAVLIVCFVGNLLVFVAADAVTFYLGFTVMSFVGYVLVVHTRTPEARRASRIYLVMTVIGEGAVLAALMLTVAAGGLMLEAAPAAVAASEHRDLIIALLFVGFGVKAGTVPLHVWLPLAHPAAPTPASAVLSGVMIKAGLVGWLRFLPLGEMRSVEWAHLIIAVALLGAVLAVPAGLLQDDPKVVLAYSSISQMGFLAVLVGVAFADPDSAAVCIAAAVVYAIHHGLAKGALFLGLDAWTRYANRWVVASGLLIAAVTVIGVPLTGGHIAKYVAKEAVGDVTFALGTGIGIALLLTLIGLGSTVLLARFGWLVARTAPGSARLDAAGFGWLIMIAVGVGATAWFADRGSAGIQPPNVFDPLTWPDQLWPFALGLGLALGAAWAAARDLPPAWLAHPRGDVVPPGDLVVPEERLVRALTTRGGAVIAGFEQHYRGMVAAVTARLTIPRWVDAAQRRLDVWHRSGLAVLGLLAAALLLAMGGR